MRAFHILRTLAPRVDVDVVSLVHDPHEEAQAGSIRALGARVTTFQVGRSANYARAIVRLAGNRPLTHLLLDAPGMVAGLTDIVRERPPDVVLAYCSSMARFALEPPLAEVPLVLDLVDVDSEKWATLAVSAAWPKRLIYRREARHLARFERLAAMQAYANVVVNEREEEALRRLAPKADIRIVPNGVDVTGLQPRAQPSNDPRVIFCGVMDYAPNVDGVLWFSREVWPRIRAHRPEAQFFVVGSDPTATVRQLDSPNSGIHVTGTVPDVRSYLWEAAVSVAPLMVAQGVQNKVLEALAAGLPAVVTSQVLAGLPSEVRTACRTADSSEAFAEQTLALLALSGPERRAVAARADCRGLHWETRLAPLLDILTSAGSSRVV